MGEKPYQFSLFSLLTLTTALTHAQLVNTFPRASICVAEIGLMLAGPLLFFLGSLLVFHGEVFFRKANGICSKNRAGVATSPHRG